MGRDAPAGRLYGRASLRQGVSTAGRLYGGASLQRGVSTAGRLYGGASLQRGVSTESILNVIVFFETNHNPNTSFGSNFQTVPVEYDFLLLLA